MRQVRPVDGVEPEARVDLLELQLRREKGQLRQVRQVARAELQARGADLLGLSQQHCHLRAMWPLDSLMLVAC